MTPRSIKVAMDPGSATPELRWLLALTRRALGTENVESHASPPIGPEAFEDLLLRHRLGPFLSRRLRGGFSTSLSPAHQSVLREADHRNATLALVRSGELVRIARRLGAAGIPFVSVKGPLLARSLYGEVGARHSGDLDLLVPVEQILSADRLLKSIGYRRSQPCFELTPRQFSAFQQLKHEFEYFNESGTVRLEIEWRLSGLDRISPAELVSSSTTTQLAATSIARLPETLEFLYLFVHGAGHAWFRLFWLVDVALLLQRPDMDWSALMDLARIHGVETCVWQGALLAKRLFGIPTPTAIGFPAEEVERITRLTSEGWRMIQSSDAERDRVIEVFQQLAYQMRLRIGWRARAAVLRPLLGMPENWRILPLPDSCFALYTPLAPALWVWRRLSRRRS